METRARYILVGLFTLAAVAAGFGFVYWLNNSGGLAKRSVYRIQFESTVSGLQTGAVVQFNGIRVGEVTGLRLEADDPGHVTATIAVSSGTPLRADTKIGMEFQGLTGTPVVSLRGGTAGSALLAGSESDPPLLTADPGSVQDLTQTARLALQHADRILSDNSESVKSTIDNLKTFSGALARNSDKIDGVMAGLQRLAGGGPAEKPRPLYDLIAPSSFPPMGSATHGQLVVNEPTAVVAFQTQRMLARSSDGEITQLGDAQWSDALPSLVQKKLIQSFENAGLLSAVTPPVDRVNATFQLLLDLRSFEILLGAEPMADVEFSAKIIGGDGHIVGAQLIHATVPTGGTGVPDVAAALNQAFGKAATELVAWAVGVI